MRCSALYLTEKFVLVSANKNTLQTQEKFPVHPTLKGYSLESKSFFKRWDQEILCFFELDDRQKDDEPNQCSGCRDDVFLIEEHGDKDKREKCNRQRVQDFICRNLESVFHKVARLTVAIMSNHCQNANKNIDVAAN